MHVNFTINGIAVDLNIEPERNLLINCPDLRPAGAGETPIVAITPAVSNATFDAYGVRFRAKSITPGGSGQSE